MKYLLPFLVLLFVGVTSAHAQQVAVIAHPSVPLSQIDGATLRAIYSLDRTQWSDNSRVVVLTNEEASSRPVFLRIGIGQDQLKRVWLRKKLAGEGEPPATVAGSSMVQRVAATPGAIGFVDASQVDGSVKVLARL